MGSLGEAVRDTERLSSGSARQKIQQKNLKKVQSFLTMSVSPTIFISVIMGPNPKSYGYKKCLGEFYENW
jgi:hypothetical protein